jgi:2-dehydropantoate 2-reductase
MKITVAVLGPGAVGGTFIARFLGAQYRTICVAPRVNVQVLALAGLSFEQNGAEPLVVRPEATERLVHPVSLLVVAVKAPQLEEAIERIEPDAVAHGVVLPLLNGLEHMEPLRERFGDRVAAGALSRFEAYRPGRVQVIQKSHTALVTMASDTLSDRDLERAVDLLEKAGIDAEVGSDEKRVLWTKVARLAVLAPATALTQRTVGSLRTDIDWRPRLERAVEEACAVATADGVNLMPSAQWTRITEMDAGLTTSAARDVAAGRPNEIDAITGAVVRAGERLGVPTPVLSGLAEQAARLR